jgi:hypothetical protein
MKINIWTKAVLFGITLASVPLARAANVGIDFDQFGYVYTSYTSSTVNTRMAGGSYFGFGSFNSSFDPTTITQSNILSTLRSSANWFKSFETAYIDSDDTQYNITSATAATDDRQLAYVVYINDSLANVQAALLAGSATGISTQFGIFTYANTNPSLRYDLPRDPGVAPDRTLFSNEFGLGTGINNFVPVAGKGSQVGIEGVLLIPEPTSGSLFFTGIALLALCKRARKSA